MKEAFCSLIMAFSMFSVIPMPRIRWKEETANPELPCGSSGRSAAAWVVLSV